MTYEESGTSERRPEQFPAFQLSVPQVAGDDIAHQLFDFGDTAGCFQLACVEGQQATA